MRTSRQILVIMLIVLSTASVWANPVSPEQAKQLASSFITGKTTVDPVSGLRTPRRAPAKSEIETKVVLDATDGEGQPLMYAVNFTKQGGFVLVSGDDRFNEVLGYSDEDNFDEQDMPDNMRAWLQGYVEEMNHLKSINYQPSVRRTPSAKAAIEPLVTTKWNQSSPYNDLCPIDTNGKRSVTGCTATAFAQIINYHIQNHNAPTTVIAEIPGYTTKSHGLEVAAIPAGTAMPEASLLLDEYNDQATDAQKEAVAKLMLYCGTSVHMDYTSSESGALFQSIPQVLADNFGFDNTARQVNRGDYTYAAWCDIFYQELAAGRPVQFAASTAGGAHAFLVDGFDGEYMYHVNWGWGGRENGYFALSVMTKNQPDASSSGANYTMDQYAIIGIQINTGSTLPPAATCISMTAKNFNIDGQKAVIAAYNWTGEVRSFDLGIGLVEVSGEITPITYWTANDLCINCGWGDLNFTVPTNTDYAYMTRKVIPISREKGTETWCSATNVDKNYFLAEYDADGVPHLTVHPVVDLQASSLSIPSNKYVSEEQTVRLSLTNNGDEYYGKLYFFVSTDETIGEKLSETCITGLVGSTQNFTFNWTPETTGTYQLSVALDSNGENVLATTSVTITTAADPGIAGKAMVITDVNFEGLDRNSLQIDEVTGVRTYNVYAEELKGKVSIKNISAEPITCRLRFCYDEYDEQSGQYILDTKGVITYGNFTYPAGAGYSLNANKQSVTIGKTYRVRIDSANSATDFDDHFEIRLLPPGSLLISTLAEDIPNPVYWSITPNVATAGTAIDVTYCGTKKVKCVTPQPFDWEMYYSGAIQTFTAPATGVYELHAWGAQGGKSGKAGGLGGYATCRTNLTAGETIYIYVGGRGGAESKEGGAGGWNGGGKGGSGYGSYNGSAGGGGATHISKVNNQVLGSGSGECASLAGTDYILVAGGGGGASHRLTSPGAGGGTDGGKGTRYTSEAEVEYSDYFYYSTTQSFGADGGNGSTGSCSAEGAGGGGGGFYGGTSNAAYDALSSAYQDAGGCGGSSAYNSNLATDFSTTAGQREGNGKVEIRLISATEWPALAEVTKIADNHWQYTMPAANVNVEVAYVTDYASLTAAPTAISGLTYNGSAQTIINAGEAEGGTLYYSLDNYNWSATVPVAISGQHTVYYKVVGDANHLDYIPSPNTIYVAITDFEGAGTADDPYLIPSELAWNNFACKVNNGNVYEGKYFRQTADISVTSMAGTSTYPFKGIYDGAGHTLTVAYNTTEEYTAPFRYIEGATIKNLRTDGTITTSNKFAGSIAGRAQCNNTIINCRGGVTITSTVDGDGTHGGIIGLMQGDNTNNTVTTIEGCVFNGKLLGSTTNCCGGFVGWCPSAQLVKLELTNNLYAPQEVTFNTSWCQTFSRGGDMNLITITNCYYSQTLGGVQGKQRFSITGVAGVTVANAGEATEYTVSGITSYGTGIKYDGVPYAGQAEKISLALSHADAPSGYMFDTYTASVGTLTDISETGASLTMPEANVEILANFKEQQVPTVLDNTDAAQNTIKVIENGTLYIIRTVSDRDIQIFNAQGARVE